MRKHSEHSKPTGFQPTGNNYMGSGYHDHILDFNVESLQSSIQKGYNPSGTDEKGRNALHVLLHDEFEGTIHEAEMLECLKILVDSTEDDICNCKDASGETPLSLAVNNGFVDCVKYLVDIGADTTAITGRYPRDQDLAYAIAKSMPQIMLSIFDRSISVIEELNSESGTLNKKVKLNWKSILQENKDDRLQGKQNAVRETKFLYRLLGVTPEDRVVLLSHPLITAFMHLKYKSFRATIWIYQVLMAIYPLFYMGFLWWVYFDRCRRDADDDDDNDMNTDELHNWNIFEEGKENDKGRNSSLSRRCSFNNLIFVCGYALAIVAVGFLLLEIYIQFKIDWRMMIKRDWKPWVTRISLVLMGFTLWPVLQVQKGSYNISWQYAVAALGAFFSWVWFLLQIELIPKVKVYLEQLVAILLSVLRIILLFFPLFFGFYTGFNMIFPGQTGVMSFILMTIDPSEINQIEDNDTDSRFTVMANMFIVAFIVVISLVFINYLLAASVSNMEGSKDQAKVIELSIQVQRLFLIDVLYSKNDTEDGSNDCYVYNTKCSETDTELPREIRKEITKLLVRRHQTSK